MIATQIQAVQSKNKITNYLLGAGGEGGYAVNLTQLNKVIIGVGRKEEYWK